MGIRTASAGRFAIDVFTGGSPIWCHLSLGKEGVAVSFTHQELTDLIYVAQKALEAARQQLTPDELAREMCP